MRRLFTLLAICFVLALPGAGAAQDAREERYVIRSNGETVGSIVASIRGREIEVEYMVDNNGRGPRLRHALVLGEDGLPTSWRIEGRSTFGGPVSEVFEQSQGRARWTSQADRGEAAAPSRRLYVANDDTPWSEGLYARALLSAPDGSLDVLPAGALRLERVREATLGEGARRIDGVIYRLVGLGLSPSLFMLDREGRLVAEVSDGAFAIREGYESEEQALRLLARELEQERFVALQRQLAHRFDAPVRIRNARVFDPRRGRVSALANVTVFRDRIVTVEAGGGEPDSAYYDIDAEGGVLMPGLHDMHAHVSLQSALLYLAAGVTGVRDQGNDNERLLDLLERVQSGELAGPRIVRNGMIEGRSPFSVRLGRVVDSEQAALEAVRWYAAHGYWQVKIYNSLNPEWVRPVIQEARRLGMGASGHVPAFMSPDAAIEAGYDDIAHINQLMLGWLIGPGEDTRTPLRLSAMARAAELDLRSRPVRRTLSLMRRHGVALDTTAVTLETLMLSRAGEIPPSHTYTVDHMPIGYQRYRRRSFVTIETPEDDRRYRAGFQRILETLSLLHRNGVRLLPGTDDGTGYTLHRELELYVAAGISPAETLRMATFGAEEYFGRTHELGAIERGKLADFILLAGDPTENISAVRQVRMTMRGGVAYFPSEIYTAFGIRPFAAPPAITPPRAQP